MKYDNFKSVIDVNLSCIVKIDEMLFADEYNGKNGAVISSGGRLVYLSSISGIAGAFGQTNYSTSKSAIIGYVSGLAKKWN